LRGGPGASNDALTLDPETRLRALVLGAPHRIAGTVYGTIVVLASLTVGADAYQHDLWRLAGIAGSTVLVLWIAHVYSHGLGESLSLGRRLTADELAAIARRELAILLAAAVPLAFVVLGALGVLRGSTALWLAVGAGVVTLTAQGVRYARLERLSRTGTAVTVAVNLALGLAIVALKVGVAH
jgi:hypothetical protein